MIFLQSSKVLLNLNQIESAQFHTEKNGEILGATIQFPSDRTLELDWKDATVIFNTLLQAHQAAQVQMEQIEKLKKANDSIVTPFTFQPKRPS